MNTEQLIELLSERPFVPMRLRMSNGRTHEIRHPELAIVGEGIVAIGVATDEGARPKIRFASIPHINEIEFVNGTVANKET